MLRAATAAALASTAVATTLDAQGQRLREVPLRDGMEITESVRIRPGIYRFEGRPGLDHPIVTIRGRNITVDLTDVVLEGSSPDADPDTPVGLGIHIDGMDLSHQWKPRLLFGAAMYLEDVHRGRIQGNRARQGKHGLLMTRTDSLGIRDNDFTALRA